jgi:hypothetical protein
MHYVGRYGSKQAKAEYDRLIGEWLESGRQLLTAGAGLAVNELMVRYMRFVEGYYVKDGRPTSEQDSIRQALRPVKNLYGHTLAKDFGPLALKAVRREMVKHRIVRKIKVTDPESGEKREEEKLLAVVLARKNINKQTGQTPLDQQRLAVPAEHDVGGGLMSR